MSKTLIGIIVAIIVIGGGFFLLKSPVEAPTPDMGGTTSAPHETTNPNATSTSTGTSTVTGSPSGATSYTKAQVATHNNQTSCWSIIDGNVYDLTEWIGNHPGGPEAILSICGKDGSAAFHGQHDDAKRQADILATMKIGVLAN